MPNSGIFRVAVVQCSSVILDVDKTVEKLEKYAKEAADNGAKLVLFPEAFISCYPRGTNFGEGREKFRKYWESSVDIPGPVVDKLSKIAEENKIHLVTGVIERDEGTLYCSVIFFDDTGKYLGKHRKLIPTAAERLVWGRGDGSTMPVFDTAVGKIGAVICWENYMPLLRVTMYSKGVQIYCAPTADAREEWTSTMRHIALEGRCFVLGCNQYNRKSDYPPGFIDDEYDGLLGNEKGTDYIMSRGGSVIVSPMGKFLAGPVFDKEEVLYADLDLDDIQRGKLDFDAVGHYARPDVFTLHVNEKENHTTVTESQTQ
ncbi:bifunctional nitrilase/nitrile hydratase NIT4A-like isoform X2 [Bradysia coprophila]|uniref:bifunctional nitrilase/nitrile hydratase NIT4A-like isoform X2 n=1 Tax=Bradysia coprophila TaxID=38358 RepID=UPI00187D7771|nr:bifunctional nitrilase/nitrile hydratase NIT4A-like isoform X2 [Bradysia coprophila]